MSLKISSHKIFVFISFLLALFGLSFFFSVKIPFLSTLLTADLSKALVLVFVTLLSLIFYILFLFFKKEILIPENKLVRIMFLGFPALVILSSIFSGNLGDNLFGKYLFMQSGIAFLSIIFLTYLLSSYSKISKRLSWILFVLGNLLVTVAVILGILFSKFGMSNFANKIVFLVDSWDIVAAVSGMFVVIALVYFETIAFSKKQKIITGILIGLHIIILILVLIPDIWLALLLASLAVFLIARNKRVESEEVKLEKKVFYKQYSFYIFIISLVFTVFLSISSAFTNNIVTKLGTFTSKYTGVSYNFIKPKINVSMGLGWSQLKQGKVFGSGPSDFYKVWQKEKPQSVVNSNYWGTDFTSSYSTFTTFFTTIGIIGAILVGFIVLSVLFTIWKKLKKTSGVNSYLELDEENRFYLVASSASFIFSAALFFFFANVIATLIFLAITMGLVLSHTIKWKEVKVSKIYFAIFGILFILILIGFIMIINRVRATSVSANSIKAYQVDSNINNLENGLLKAARISNDDSDYRLLSQFYVFKTQQILNNQAATDTTALEKEVLNSMNNAIASAKTAINLDIKDYNNYIALGNVYSFLMTIDKENRDTDYNNAKEAFGKAYSLYPKNPSIYLSLANLEYSYSKNIDSTAATIKKSLEIKPNYSSAFYLFSQLAVQANDRDAAINYAAQAVQADPQSVDAYLQYGVLILNKKELNQEELNQAYTAFMSVLNIDRNNLTAAYYLSVTYILAKDYTNADNIISALEKILPNDQRIIDLRKFYNNSKGGTATPVADITTKDKTKK